MLIRFCELYDEKSEKREDLAREAITKKSNMRKRDFVFVLEEPSIGDNKRCLTRRVEIG